jgi:hypothetical protein
MIPVPRRPNSAIATSTAPCAIRSYRRRGSAFRENEIDETVHLTLGVYIVGHRRKVLDAIAALRTDTGVKAPSIDVSTAPSPTSVSSEDRAEGRQVTVMFSRGGSPARNNESWGFSVKLAKARQRAALNHSKNITNI